MLNFKEITVDDKAEIEKYTKRENYFICSYCFTDLFMWSVQYKTSFCIEDGFLFLKSGKGGQTVYLPPIGEGDFKAAVEKLNADADMEGVNLSFRVVPPQIKDKIEETFPNLFVFTEDLGSQDYIYLSESIISLKGKKLHAKRNYINRFKANYEGRWQYEEIGEGNIKEVFDFHLDWCRERGCHEQEEYLAETCAISRALKNYDALGLKGGLIRLDGDVIAFSLGSEFNDEMFIVHIEKAKSEIAGAYQMINQQFAAHNASSYKYIDREEDLGIEGLRKAKKSYFPVKMGVNYSASPIDK